MCEKTEQICDDRSRRGSLTLRQAAAMAEMASLGLRGIDAAMLLDVSPAYICKLRKRFGIAFAPRLPRFSSWRYRSIARLRAANLTYPVIAERLGSTAASCASMAYQMRQAGQGLSA